ncbi:MAG: hypothetical protein PVTTEEND_000535 [Candidatus Fervidibacter sp.]
MGQVGAEQLRVQRVHATQSIRLNRSDIYQAQVALQPNPLSLRLEKMDTK